MRRFYQSVCCKYIFAEVLKKMYREFQTNFRKFQKNFGEFQKNLGNFRKFLGNFRKILGNFRKILEKFKEILKTILGNSDNFPACRDHFPRGMVSFWKIPFRLGCSIFYPTTQQKSGNVFSRGVRSFVRSFLLSQNHEYLTYFEQT